jgi:radical SAM protein with 4Fe4S-binding SPASM domain
MQTEPQFRKIYVEIGNVCNLKCSFCPEVERKSARLHSEELRRILIQVKPLTDRVCFHLMGEPLAHPEFAPFVAIAAEVGIPVEITTNGTLLSPAVEEALLLPIVHQVNFSLQSFFDNFPGANPETYIRKIFAFTGRALEERPDLYINFRLWNLQAADKEDTANEKLLQKIEEAFSVEINRRVDPRLRKSKNLKGRLYLHYDTRFEWPSLLSPVLREQGSCQGGRTHLGIHADGTLVPCCLDKEARINLGNVKETPIEELLQSERFRSLRRGFETGKLTEDLCRRCQYATRFSG